MGHRLARTTRKVYQLWVNLRREISRPASSTVEPPTGASRGGASSPSAEVQREGATSVRRAPLREEVLDGGKVVVRTLASSPGVDASRHLLPPRLIVRTIARLTSSAIYSAVARGVGILCTPRRRSRRFHLRCTGVLLTAWKMPSARPDGCPRPGAAFDPNRLGDHGDDSARRPARHYPITSEVTFDFLRAIFSAVIMQQKTLSSPSTIRCGILCRR